MSSNGVVRTGVGPIVPALVSHTCNMDELLRKTSALLYGYTSFEAEARQLFEAFKH